MNTTLPIPLASLVDLCTAAWRLRNSLGPALESPGSSSARRSLRKIEDFCRAQNLEARSLTALPYDAGLAVRVVETLDDPALPPNSAIISETLSPMVLYEGKVLREAEVVVSRHPI